MAKKTIKVRPEDLKNYQEWFESGPKWFIGAVENGELVWIPKSHSDEEVQRQVSDELIEFVKPIRQYASKDWQMDNHIDQLWKTIIARKRFYSSLVRKKGIEKDHLNHYRAAAFIFALCNDNIYLADKATLIKTILPESEVENIRKNATNPFYALDEADKKELERLIKRCKKDIIFSDS